MSGDLRGLSDDDLVRRMAEGEVGALDVLYDRYARAVYAFAVRIVGDGLLAEEVLQEAFVRAWQQAGRFELTRGRFPSWLLSITHNLAIDEVRKRQRRPQRADAVDIADVLQGEVDTTVDVEEAAEAAELRARIQAAMATLPEPQRRVIELAYFDGLTQREISTFLDEPLGTIKTRMRLGMQKLRDLLAAEEGAQR
ncbi:MAG TPA: sigma-70 family RNA polymerase sigma factor [Thermomicrobiaceae bacterium]|nr:sigma-70 family RNA polymerase sigma factor [Thermomicrobiaceae bacterium]